MDVDIDADEASGDNAQLLPMQVQEARHTELAAIVAQENALAPWRTIALLILVWLGYFVITFLLYHTDAVKRCSGAWVTILLLSIPYVALITWYWGRVLLRKEKVKSRMLYAYCTGDMRWTPDAVVRYPLLCFFAGVAAALTGIGGGLVKSPIMLEMGMLPAVVTATSSFMIIFTSSASSIQYIILGKVPLVGGVLVFVTGFVGAVVGQSVVNYLVAKYKQQAFLILLLAALTVVSGVCIIAVDLAKGLDSSKFNVGELCNN